MLHRNGSSRVNLYSEASTPLGPRVLKSWDRFLSYTPASAATPASTTKAAGAAGSRP